MKTLKKLIFSVLFLLPLLTACDEREYEFPDQLIPESEWAQNKKEQTISIRELLDKYAKQALDTIADEIYIRGIITANDISGNVYKQIQMQDATGGINIQIDASGLHKIFRIGQDIVVKCQGLYYGEYRGLPQLGVKTITNGKEAIGRMGLETFNLHSQKDGLPNVSQVDTTFVELDELSLESSLVGQLITVKNVSFVQGGDVTFASTDASENRILTSAGSSKSITARMSNYATFATDTLPTGIGSITGIFTRFDTTMQILIRDKDDCDFQGGGSINKGEGDGSESSPYDVTAAYKKVGETDKWVKGYIVGAVKTGNDHNAIQSNDNVIFGATGDIRKSAVLIAASKDEKNYTNCLVIRLADDGNPANLQSAVNLVDHPENLGKELIIKGRIASNCFGREGVRDVTAFKLEGGIVNVGTGTFADPYSIAYALANQSGAISGWIEGYIVGAVSDGPNAGNPIKEGDIDFAGASDFMDLTVVLAQTTDVKDWTKVVVVKLPIGSDIYSKVNLADNRGNIAKKLKVNGRLENIWGAAGLITDGAKANFILEGDTPPIGDPVTFLSEDFQSFKEGTGFEYMSKQPDAKGWTGVNIAGELEPDVRMNGSNKYVQFSAHRNSITTAAPQEFWLISPALDLTNAPSKILSFETVIAYPNAGTVFEVYILDSNNPATAGKTKLNPRIAQASDISGTYSPFIPSGNIDLSSHTGVKFIGFHYKGTSGSGNAATYQMDNFKFGDGTTPPPPPPPPGDEIFLETCGNSAPLSSAGPPAPNAYTDWDNKAPVVFSGNTDVRSTAKLDSHVWFSANNNKEFIISGINTAGCTDLKLSFKIACNNAAGDASKMTLTVKDIANSGSEISITVPGTPVVTANEYVEVKNLEGIPATANLEIKFVFTTANNPTGFGYRLDNIRIDGTKP